MTTTHNHTPGPWKIDSIDNAVGDIWIAAHNAPTGVAIVQGDLRADNAITLANARLIAAAPELLAALQDALSYIRHDCEERGIPYCFTNAERTLSKAEGRG